MRILQNLMKEKSGKKLMSMIACVLLVVILVSNAGLHMTKANEQESERAEFDRKERGEQEYENFFTEEGTTSMGTVSQLPEFSTSVATMYVEEVYVEAGSTVAEGDALFKITEGSMEDAKAYYVSAIATAEDTLEDAQLAYASGKLEAEYEKQNTELTAESAAAALEIALTELEDDLEEKYGKWQGTVNNIIDCTNNIEEDVYYTKAGIGEKTTAAEQAKGAEKTAQAEYNTANIAYESALSQLENDITALEAAASANEDVTELATSIVSDYKALKTAEQTYDAKRAILETAKLTAQKATQTLEQAKQEYEKNLAQAEKDLEQMEESVDTLQNTYETASREAETKRLELQNEYETAILEGEYAQANYDATIRTLQTAVDNAIASLEELKEEQEKLLSLENGVVCAERAGTLASVTYEAEDILFPGTAFVTYYDTSELTISLEVEQENIAKLEVGDEVRVAIFENRRGNMTGKVASIATSATTGRSVSDVTYTVVISIDNQNNELSAGSSATVTFEYEDERGESDEDKE